MPPLKIILETSCMMKITFMEHQTSNALLQYKQENTYRWLDMKEL